MNISRVKNRFNQYGFLSPVAITMLALLAFPIGYAVYISMFDTNLINRWEFVGLKNYILTLKDTSFFNSFKVSLIFTIFSVLGNLIIGMILALILNSITKGRTLFRIILFLPWLIPDVVAALLWKWMYHSTFGIINNILLKIHLISKPIAWLAERSTALPSVIIANIWKGFPFVMIMILAGLQTIPDEQYEAAALDGCTKWQLFLHIILPWLRYILIVTLVLDTIWAFKHFTMAWVLTAGGPIEITNVLSIGIYKYGFSYFKFGQAAAAAMIIFIIIFIISYIYTRFLRNE